MNGVILDTKTGIRRSISGLDAVMFDDDYWYDGNGSCDCNRAIYVVCEEELDTIMRLEHPELKSWQSVCVGCQRCIIIEADSKKYTLRELNKNYPPELLDIFLDSGGTYAHA